MKFRSKGRSTSSSAPRLSFSDIKADKDRCFALDSEGAASEPRDRLLTNRLAERVMGWRVCRDRYMIRDREWIFPTID